MPNGQLISLPIPDAHGKLNYSNLQTSCKLSYYEVMEQLSQTVNIDRQRVALQKTTCCHCDPDINTTCQPRPIGWRGAFGQIGAAQKHLERHNVGAGDLFLFFGWFRKTLWNADKLFYGPTATDVHLLFGYLQIEKVVKIVDTDEIPAWLKNHPHASADRISDPSNTIYTAADNCTWNNNLAGWGTFRFNSGLFLTKTGYSRSKWDLPLFFKKAKITYHSTKSWKEGYFQSAARGQEFIINENKDVEKWATQLIDKSSDRLN